VDVESGNVTIKKTSDDSTIETISVTDSKITGTGTTQITINPAIKLVSLTGYYLNIDATAFDDPSGNSYAGFTDSTTLNFATGDYESPTLSSSTPADGATKVAVNANIVLTFSKVVDVESGNITIKKTSDNSTIETIAVTDAKITGTGTTQITINPSTTLDGETDYYITIASTAFDDLSGNSYAGITDSTTLNFTTVVTKLPSPLGKKDVIDTIKTFHDFINNWANFSINNAFSRITWLSMNEDSTRTSHQGIKFRFRDEIIDVIMNKSPNSNIYDEIYFADKAYNSINNTDGSLLAVSDQIKTDAGEIFYNEASRLRDAIIGSLNPTFEPVIDNWSMWTDGKIMVGKSGGTSKQDIDSQAISLGFDKPMNNEGLVGFVIEIGQNNADIGEDGTNVKSDNYSLSNYTVFSLDPNTKLESVIGIGHLKIDTIRSDGSETLIGERHAAQRYVSTRLVRKNKINFGRWKAWPYIMHSTALTNLDGFSETGGSTALTFDDQQVRDSKVGVGVDIHTKITTNNNDTIKPFSKIEYNRSSSKTSATMYYSSEGPENSYTSTDNKGNTSWKLKLGADLITESGWNGSTSYTREQSVRSGLDYEYSNIFRFNIGKRF
jgi:uncharacterized protein with beta-barrel porin domain